MTQTCYHFAPFTHHCCPETLQHLKLNNNKMAKNTYAKSEKKKKKQEVIIKVIQLIKILMKLSSGKPNKPITQYTD